MEKKSYSIQSRRQYQGIKNKMSIAYIIQKHDDPVIQSLDISIQELQNMCFGRMAWRVAKWHPHFGAYGRHITLGSEALTYFRRKLCYTEKTFCDEKK